MMKQPDLGKKIAELRKAKGLTQEELVEKCNISVRTIQRIETGEVIPRSYTVKTILSALDYDLEKISEYELDGGSDAEGQKPITNSNPLNDTFDLNTESQPAFLVKHLTLSLIFGILYFILTFVEAPIEYIRFEDNDLIISVPFYILLKVVLLVAVVFFQRGFLLIAGLYDNYLLKVMSLMMIGAHALVIALDILSVFYNAIEPEFIMFPAAMLFGVVGIFYGVAMRRLEKPLGRAAELAGIFEIMSGCLFLTVVLAILGDIFHVPAEVCEIIILSKVMHKLKR